MRLNLNYQKINNGVVYVYWNIGRIIASNENDFNNRLEYGKEVLKGLSNELTEFLYTWEFFTNISLFWRNKFWFILDSL